MAEIPFVRGLEPKPKRPWWATAVISGIGIGLTVLTGLGVIGMPTKAEAAATAAVDSGRLDRIEEKLAKVAESVARIEGRLDRK